MSRFGLASPDGILIVVDETALDLGQVERQPRTGDARSTSANELLQVRLRAKGSTNGHNGLRDIERVLGGPQYPRLRIGVGRPGSSSSLADYVLGEFTATEQKKELPFALAAVMAKAWKREGGAFFGGMVCLVRLPTDKTLASRSVCGRGWMLSRDGSERKPSRTP
eukprot:scaffold1234_cov248-Pinguiococcus_pyrenoidosus.AAC.2